MAMFNKKTANSKGQTDNGGRNHISPGTLVKGEIEADGNVRIDGTVEGSIKCKGKVVIGQEGVINGNVHTADAEIEGRLNGDITLTGTLYLKSTAHVEGDFYVSEKNMKIDFGAIHNGKCIMKAGSGAAAKPSSTSNGTQAQVNGKADKKAKAAAAH